MRTIANRLEEARELRGRTIRSVQQALKEKRVPGSSYANVYAIFKGETLPPLPFIEAVAEELHIAVAWLAFEAGPATPEAEEAEGERKAASDAAEAAASPQLDRQTRERETARRFKWSVLSELVGIKEVVLPELPPGPIESRDAAHAFAQHGNFASIPAWVPALMELEMRYGHRTIGPREIGHALRAPLDEIKIDPGAGMDSTYRTLDWLDDYIAGMVPVLLALAPERARQFGLSSKQHA